MRVFISGPLGENGANLSKFPDAARRLAVAGLEPVQPCFYVQGYGTESQALLDDPLWIGDCIEDVGRCDGVALLDGWRSSPGAMLEVGWALARGLQVLNLACWLDGSWQGWPERAEARRRVIENAMISYVGAARHLT